MELKLSNRRMEAMQRFGINRTFMELKQTNKEANRYDELY